MASISNESNGCRRLLFIDAAGKRKTLRLGKTDKRNAETVKGHVEHIVNCQMSRDTVERRTAEWLGELEPTLRTKFERVGLLKPADKPAEVETNAVTLGPFVDSYIAERKATGSAVNSIENYQQARESLCDYFGPTKPLADITEADAEKWRRWMLTSKDARKQSKAKANGGLGENTANRRCGFARQFFTNAVDARLIAENPFRKLKGIAVRANVARDYIIRREDAAKVLDEYPDAEGRLIFALARYGGLRCPSEHLALSWGDVDWVGSKLRIDSPKTGVRVIPIFPELRPYLDDAFALAGERGIDPNAKIITRRVGKNVNWRTELERMIVRAGLKPWPKLFQNLRLTRQNELSKSWPVHVVCEWIGNSQAVAMEHYLRVTDDDFARATAAVGVAHNPAQQASVQGGMARYGETSPTKTAGNFNIPAVSESNLYTPQESNL